MRRRPSTSTSTAACSRLGLGPLLAGCASRRALLRRSPLPTCARLLFGLLGSQPTCAVRARLAFGSTPSSRRRGSPRAPPSGRAPRPAPRARAGPRSPRPPPCARSGRAPARGSVVVLGRVEVGRQRLDQLLRHLDLALGRLARRRPGSSSICSGSTSSSANSIVSIVSTSPAGPDRGQVLLRADHDARDRDLVGSPRSASSSSL